MKFAIMTALVLSVFTAYGIAMPCHLLAAEKTIEGTVKVVEDGDGKTTAVMIVTEGGDKYSVTLDDNGKKLGKELNDKKAEVTGEIKDENDAKTITVASFKEK